MGIGSNRNRASLAISATLYAMLAIAVHGSAIAQSYPSRPITMVVPFPPGGTSDANARLIAQEITKSLGQPVIIENRPGANGNIGSATVARAAPDGHTILLSGVGSHAINAGIYKNMPYDPVTDFAHITMIASGPNAIAVNPRFPPKTIQEFMKFIADNPGKFDYASSGTGSSGNMAMEMFKQTAKLDIRHIPYRGGAPATTDVLANQVPILITNAEAVLPLVRTDSLRILAVTSATRNPLYPDTPTIAEAGFPNFAALSWTGISAPAKTPKAIIARLHDEIVRALKTPIVRERLVQNGLSVQGNTPEEYTKFIASEVVQWSTVAKSAGITVE